MASESEEQGKVEIAGLLPARVGEPVIQGRVEVVKRTRFEQQMEKWRQEDEELREFKERARKRLIALDEQLRLERAAYKAQWEMDAGNEVKTE